MTKYKGTLSLLLLSVALQCLCSLVPSLVDWLAMDPSSWLFPINLLTSIVSHANWPHLVGNYMFGLPAMMFLEEKLGKNKFLELFLLCGVFGAMLDVLMMGPHQSIGSSGAISGMLAAACCLFGKGRLEHLLAMAFLLCFLIPQIDRTAMEAFTNIGYWCHVGGALAGILLTQRLYRPLPEVKPCKPHKKH